MLARSLRLTIAAVNLRVDLGDFPRPGVDGARPPRGARGGISLRLLPDRLRAGLRDPCSSTRCSPHQRTGGLLVVQRCAWVPSACGAPSGFRLALGPPSVDTGGAFFGSRTGWSLEGGRVAGWPWPQPTTRFRGSATPDRSLGEPFCIQNMTLPSRHFPHFWVWFRTGSASF